MQEGKTPVPVDVTGSGKFNGSWSGYERDDFFCNPDGPSTRFYQSAYVLGLDFDDDGRCAVAVDIDGDGDLDLALESLQGLRLMENTAPRRSFASVRLTATKTNKYALNAIAHLTAGGATQQDYVRMTDGYQAQCPLDLHFGLADAKIIDELVVNWPSGGTQVFRGLPVDRLIEITEGSDEPAYSELKSWSEETRPKKKPAFSFELAADRIDAGRGPIAEKGLPFVINFWAPWCAGCKKELPDLARLAVDRTGKARFVGVSVETKDAESVKATIASFGLKYPQFFANDDLMRSFFGDSGQAPLPATFVFDGQGRLRRIFSRAVDASEIASLLDTLQEEGIHTALYWRQAEYLLELNKLDEALPFWDKIVAADPGRAEAWFQRGVALFRAHRDDESAQSLRKAIALEPAHAKAHYNLGVALIHQKRTSEAIPEIEEALRIEGETVGMLVTLSVACAELERWPEADRAAERALKADPAYAPAWLQKGKLLIVSKDYENARKHLQRALEIDSQLSEAREYLFQLGALKPK